MRERESERSHFAIERELLSLCSNAFARALESSVQSSSRNEEKNGFYQNEQNSDRESVFKCINLVRSSVKKSVCNCPIDRNARATDSNRIFETQSTDWKRRRKHIFHGKRRSEKNIPRSFPRIDQLEKSV